jgi:hypothetical protein
LIASSAVSLLYRHTRASTLAARKTSRHGGAPLNHLCGFRTKSPDASRYLFATYAPNCPFSAANAAEFVGIQQLLHETITSKNSHFMSLDMTFPAA